MEGVDWLIITQEAKSTIDLIAVVVIPLEVLMLTLVMRRWVFNDAYANVACAGLIGISMWLTSGGVAIPALQSVADWQWFSWEVNWATGLLHILVGDLCFYWFHRLAHTPLFFWLDHNVHHSSSDFDYSTNLRLSFLSRFYSWLPLCIPVLLGFDLMLILASFMLANSVPFFCHNQHTPKLGWVEWIFNTPSHHRVHHACNTEYKDKNFGGMLIIWDRLFGTYADEHEKVQFGLKEFEPTRNPLRIVSQGWVHLLGLCTQKPLIKKRFISDRA